jgi:inhibitor of KinA
VFEIINIGDSFISVNFIEKKINLFEVSKQLEKSKIKEIDDIVYSNSSIGIEYDSDKTNYKTISDKINNHLQSLKINSNKKKTKMWTIPICYDKEFALDIDKISKSTGLSNSSIKKIHLNQIYRVNMIGFIPGFVYMKNLNDQLKISRKKNPRLTVPEGSIGIADNMCGIYNIQSPGGWNILGRTPLSFFSIYNLPPIKIKPEDEIQFKKINKKEFFKILHEK